MLVRTAVLKVGVKESTARAWWKNYEKKTNTQNRPKSQLQEEHKQCLIELYDDNTCAYIQDAVEVLTNKFAGLEIKKSRVHESMRDNCNLTFKKATFWSEARASSYTIQKHYD
ncbi:hypothetical protein BCV72DRAFT_329302 [Rhizopus microsporus var. microsporus]|uniref:Uncharacterized protein n=2 Tax=Rhizopus microsporus TaxID=58291 RepID=A0A2G4SM71_RHIZD|nr:uncharacterized protein RHIMIDRAFT_261091 [Rhizopus microsporus ATCC 52813]ORE06262.1 hypothetical protein BCV72DRAFT_329302 [Rhizopus microsporus var. microsporus]PHZ09878.1 hypothetical protein RHIMIDRAFT_261091 [Rhizopus microsporus ATCC 52813]